MKQTLLLLIAFLSSFTAFSSEIKIESNAKNVTLYHVGALVEREADVNLAAGVNELVIRNVSSKLILNSINFSNRDVVVLNKSLVKKLSDEEYNVLLDKKEAFENQLNLLESKYKEEGFIGNVTDLEDMMQFYSSKILQIKKNIRYVNVEIQRAKDLEEIQLDNELAAILKITISCETPIKGKLAFDYVAGGIGWSPAYEIDIKSEENQSIDVKYLATVMSQTGEDWDNVQISLSSALPLASPTKLPSADEAWTLEGKSHDFDLRNQVETVLNAEQRTIQRLDGIQYDEIKVPAFLEVKTLEGKYTLKSNGTLFSFPILDVKLPCQQHYFGFPGVDENPYLVAEVTEWSSYGFIDGIAFISFNGRDAGKTRINFSDYLDTLILPIAADNSVYMKRRDLEDEKFFKVVNTSKKKKTTLAYEFELKNNNDFPVEFELVDQIPISQTKYADVELIETSEGDIDEESGEIVWNVSLQPGETVTKRLIFMIETDAAYQYLNSGRSKAKYRTISSPRYF